MIMFSKIIKKLIRSKIGYKRWKKETQIVCHADDTIIFENNFDKL